MNLRKLSFGLVAAVAVLAFSAAPAMADWFVGGSYGHSGRSYVRSYTYSTGGCYSYYRPYYRPVYRPVIVAPVYRPMVVAPVYAAPVYYPRPVVYYSPPVRSGFSFSFGTGHGHGGHHYRPAYVPRYHYPRQSRHHR